MSKYAAIWKLLQSRKQWIEICEELHCSRSTIQRAINHYKMIAENNTEWVLLEGVGFTKKMCIEIVAQLCISSITEPDTKISEFFSFHLKKIRASGRPVPSTLLPEG